MNTKFKIGDVVQYYSWFRRITFVGKILGKSTAQFSCTKTISDCYEIKWIGHCHYDCSTLFSRVWMPSQINPNYIDENIKYYNPMNCPKYLQAQ